MTTAQYRHHDAMLETIQRHAFSYFVHETNPLNGLVRDKTAQGWPCSIAAVGMALSVYPVGVARGYLSRGDALTRTLATLRFFAGSEQGDSPAATGNRGFYYHFLDMDTGRRAFDCELSSIDTALLMAGVLCAAAFFNQANPREAEVRQLANVLYERVDWRWMLAGQATVCHGWLPEKGFLQYHWHGYDEALILYMLALGSPSHGIGPESYAAWASTYAWQTVEGIELLHASSLFIHQMSHVWIDFRGLQDDFMRQHGSDYFHNSAQATRVQQRYAMRNPHGFGGYGEFAWGITASDGPGARKPHPPGDVHSYFDYVARGVPDGPDDGTLAPWAAAASLPFAPGIVFPTLENYLRLQLHLENSYGFKASFNATYPSGRTHPIGWVSPFHFGINVGPIVLMIENFRSGFVWQLCRRIPVLERGLRAAGFRGGWLDGAPASS
jgi:hypothetical protein